MESRRMRNKTKSAKIIPLILNLPVIASCAILFLSTLVIYQNKKLVFKSKAANEQTTVNIINGHTADPSKWPYVARIEVRGKDMQGTCTGALVSNQWVISAAHCFADYGSGRVVNPDDVDISFYLGGRQIYYFAKQIKFYPGINIRAAIKPESNLPDFALIQLNQDVSYTPVSLPHNDFILPELSELFSAGWGAVGFDRDGSYLTARRPNELKEIYATNNYEVSKTSSIKYPIKGLDGTLCIGDSGGPTVYRDENSSAHYLIGVTSYTISSGGEPCSSSHMTNLVNIIKYSDWIRGVTYPTEVGKEY